MTSCITPAGYHISYRRDCNKKAVLFLKCSKKKKKQYKHVYSAHSPWSLKFNVSPISLLICNKHFYVYCLSRSCMGVPKQAHSLIIMCAVICFLWIESTEMKECHWAINGERAGARVQSAEEGPASLYGAALIWHAIKSLCKPLLAVVDGVLKKTACPVLVDVLSQDHLHLFILRQIHTHTGFLWKIKSPHH